MEKVLDYQCEKSLDPGKRQSVLNLTWLQLSEEHMGFPEVWLVTGEKIENLSQI